MATDAIYTGNEVNDQIVRYHGRITTMAGPTTAFQGEKMTFIHTGPGVYTVTLNDPTKVGQPVEIIGTDLSLRVTAVGRMDTAAVVGSMTNATRTVVIRSTLDKNAFPALAADFAVGDGVDFEIITRGSLAYQ
jgi:hypothetical protein